MKIFGAVLVLTCVATILVNAKREQTAKYPTVQINPHHKYVVIGAGPGGLQLSYYLKHFDMDYVTFERQDHPGSFFDAFPRHRVLVSLNRASAGDKDMRYDWNSLLEDEENGTQHPPLNFRNFSRRYYPKADELLSYLSAFQSKHDLRVAYMHQVHSIVKNGNGFQLTYQKLWYGPIKTMTADVVIMSTGTPNHRPANFAAGNEHVLTYSDMSINPKDYEGKEILIIGGGNSAAEVADALQSVAAHVHVMGRHPLVPAFQSHYEGDIRSPNLQILDKYQLKSLDALFTGQGGEVTVEKRGDRMYYVAPGHFEGGEGIIPNFIRKGYHCTIACTGFLWDNSVFAKSPVPPKQTDCGKYPIMTSEYESVNVENMFFAGALAHMRDYRKTGGGSIHGFRYTARLLGRLLRERFEGVKVPSQEFDRANLVDYIEKRVATAHSLYLMFGTLVDVIHMSQDSTRATVIQDISMDLLVNSPHQYSFSVTSSEYWTLSIDYLDGYNSWGSMYHKKSSEPIYMRRRRTLVHSSPEEEYCREVGSSGCSKMSNFTNVTLWQSSDDADNHLLLDLQTLMTTNSVGLFAADDNMNLGKPPTSKSVRQGILRLWKRYDVDESGDVGYAKKTDRVEKLCVLYDRSSITDCLT